jgi:hypothetical protein
MNMEHAASEAAVKTANPTWVVETETKSPSELNKWGNVMGNVSAREVVFLPKNTKISLKSPGNQNFSDYSEYFLDAVVAALGVPKAILTGTSESSGGSRATAQTLSKHFYSVIRANQRYVEEVFNKIFAEYGELAGFKAPKLKFNDIAEDADRNGQRAGELFQAGLITIKEAREMIGLETTQNILDELPKPSMNDEKVKIDPDKEDKILEAKANQPDKSGRPAGSQKGDNMKN